jgi:hypothetical protein
MKLQEICKTLPYVYRSSTQVADRYRAITTIEPSTYLFTMDAVSMYTNINTPHAICVISLNFRKSNTPTPTHSRKPC